MVEIDSITSNKLSNMSLLCAFFVVCMHTWGPAINGKFSYTFVSLFQHGICLIAVPFFFVCSGFLLAGKIESENWYWPQLRKRLFNLGVPYMLWNISWMMVVLGLAFFVGENNIHQIMAEVCTCGNPSGTPYLFELSGFDWITSLGLNPFGLPFVQQLWYIRSLLVLVALSPLICHFANKRGLLVLWIVYLTIYPWGGVDHPFRSMVMGKASSFFRIMLSMEGLFYFTLGMFLRKNPFLVDRRKELLSLLIGSCFMFAYLLCSSYQIFFGGKYFRMMALPFVMVCVWTIMPSQALPKKIIGLSFPIYLIHRCVLWGFTVFHIHFGNGLVMLMFKCTAVFVVSGLVAILFRTLLPKIANAYFGGR